MAVSSVHVCLLVLAVTAGFVAIVRASWRGRDAVVGAALERGSVAGVLFAARWGGGAGKILKKIQAWLSIRRQGVRRL
jgi:hypothetical protein